MLRLGLLWGAGALLVTLALAYWMQPAPKPGDVYVRAPYDSLFVNQILFANSSASPLASRIIGDLLTRELRVQLAKTGRCETIRAHYEAVNVRRVASHDLLERALLAASPIALYDSTAHKCFAYSITYNVPLGHPIEWQGQELSSVPLHMTIIHPWDDFKYFRHEKSR